MLRSPRGPVELARKEIAAGNRASARGTKSGQAVWQSARPRIGRRRLRGRMLPLQGVKHRAQIGSGQAGGVLG